MSEQTVRGSCLCKSVGYEVSTPFMRFGHCYCSRCRKATGGVRSTNIAVPISQFRWTQGEDLIKRFDLPEAKSFARQICGNCNCPVAARVARPPAGNRSRRDAGRGASRKTFRPWSLEQPRKLG